MTIDDIITEEGSLPITISDAQYSELLEVMREQHDDILYLQEQITDLYSVIAYIYLFLIIVVVGKLFMSFFSRA